MKYFVRAYLTTYQASTDSTISGLIGTMESRHPVSAGDYFSRENITIAGGTLNMLEVQSVDEHGNTKSSIDIFRIGKRGDIHFSPWPVGNTQKEAYNTFEKLKEKEKENYEG